MYMSGKYMSKRGIACLSELIIRLWQAAVERARGKAALQALDPDCLQSGSVFLFLFFRSQVFIKSF
jgi:hypothetical protein